MVEVFLKSEGHDVRRDVIFVLPVSTNVVGVTESLAPLFPRIHPIALPAIQTTYCRLDRFLSLLVSVVYRGLRVCEQTR